MRFRRNIALISHFESVKRPAGAASSWSTSARLLDPTPRRLSRIALLSNRSPWVRQQATPPLPRWAWGLLLLLCAMNLFDSVDRWLLAAVLRMPKVRIELELSEGQAGWLATLLLLSLAISSPPIGYVVDRFTRPRCLRSGLHSGAWRRCRPGWARTNDQMQLARTLVGVGGAISSVVGLTLLMDLFPAPSALVPLQRTSWLFRWARRWP